MSLQEGLPEIFYCYFMTSEDVNLGIHIQLSSITTSGVFYLAFG